MRALPSLALLPVVVCLLGAEPRLRHERTVTVEGKVYVRTAAFLPGSDTFLLGGTHLDEDNPLKSYGEVHAVDLGTGKVRSLARNPGDGVNFLSVSADGKRLAGGTGQTIWLWDLPTGKELGKWQLEDRKQPGTFVAPENFWALALRPDGKSVAVGLGEKMWRWEPGTGPPGPAFPWGDSLGAVTFSPDLRLAVVTNQQDLDVWDTATGKRTRVLEDHRGKLVQAAFRADSKVVAVLSEWVDEERYSFTEVRLWEVTTGKDLGLRKELSGAPQGVALSPDGKLLAVSITRGFGGQGGPTLVLLDTATGKELSREKCPQGTGLKDCLTFSPDGKRLAATLHNGVRIWQIDTDPKP